MWKCKKCGELSDDNFEICWNCQAGQDGKPLKDEESLKKVAKKPSCLKCQSTMIIPNVRIVDRADNNWALDLSVEIYEDPTALIFKGTHKESLKARICGECGYAELYLDNASSFYDTYQNILKQREKKGD